MSDESVNVTSELQPCVSITTGSGESVSATSEAPCCVGVTNQGPHGDPGATGSTGSTGTQGNTGAQGAAGADGEDGEDGEDGAEYGVQWTTHSAAPSNQDGDNGDFHFEHDAHKIYHKANGVWTLLADITGQQGVPGPAGEDGADATPIPIGAKTPTSTGTIGDISFGYDSSSDSWYLFVCFATNQWGRTQFEITW